VTIAAHNAFDQWVVSGEWAALRSIAARSDATTLPVEGAWHSDAMAGAVDEYREILRRSLTMPMRVPLVSNRTGAIVERVNELPDLLALQLTHPVEWVATMDTLTRFGITNVLAVGPVKAIRGLLRRGLEPRVAIHAVESPDDLSRIVGKLA
jgi:[acyl-carrier-protein] S-malonyltransferase